MPMQQINIQKELQTAISAITDNLATVNYENYMRALIVLGKAIQEKRRITSYKQNEDFTKQLGTQTAAKTVNDHSKLAAKIFQSAWEDKSLIRENYTELLGVHYADKYNLNANNIKADQRHLAAKFPLDRETRHQVKLGIKAIEHHLNLTKLKNPDCTYTQLVEMDEKAFKAINSYQTTKQKIVAKIEKSTARVTAFAFGFIEMGTAVFALSSGSFLPLYGIRILAIGLGILSTYINLRVISAPNTLNEILSGNIANYVDDQGKHTLTRKQLASLLAFSLLAAIPTGAAIGALGYTSTLQLPAVLGLSANLTILGLSVFPVLGVIIAAFVTVGVAASLYKSFNGYVKKGQGPFDYILQPFKDIHNEINDNRKNKSRPRVVIEKGVAYVIGVLAVALGIIGLGFAAYTGAHSLTRLVHDTFKCGPIIANGIGFACGMISSIAGRLIFTFNGAAKAVVNTVKLLYGKNSPGKLDKKGLFAGIVDSCLGGIFYFVNNNTAQLATDGFLSATTVSRTLGLELASVFEQEQQQPAKTRVESLQKEVQLDTEKDTQEVYNFKKAYLSNYRSAFFKNPRSKMKCQLDSIHSMEEINKHFEQNPYSRTTQVMATMGLLTCKTN